jgi:hypothetical protein
MSIRPLFTSAPRLKLRIGSETIGYAIGFNVNVSVGVEPVYVIGEYGPVALEPTMYNVVTGAIQIVRLRSSESLTAALAASGAGALVSTAAAGKVAVKDGTAGQTTNSILNQQNLFRMLDPAQVLLTRTFDIDVYIRVPVIDQNSKLVNGENLTPGDFQIDLQSNKESNGILEEFNLMTVKDVRITSRNTNITMGTLVNEPVTFQGLLLLDQSGVESGADLIQKDSGITQG